MNRLLKLAGFLGLACLGLATLASIAVVRPPLPTARLYFEEKTKSEPVSPTQAKAFEEALALAERLSAAQGHVAVQSWAITSLGLLSLSCLCLIAGFKGGGKKKPAQPPGPAR